MLFAFMMPGPMEMIIIGVIAVLLFGSRLPKIARSVGSSITELKNGINQPVEQFEECKELIKDEIKEIKTAVPPVILKESIDAAGGPQPVLRQGHA